MHSPPMHSPPRTPHFTHRHSLFYARTKQALLQVVLVVRLEDILVVKKAEEADHTVERGVNGGLVSPAKLVAHVLIHKYGEILSAEHSARGPSSGWRVVIAAFACSTAASAIIEQRLKCLLQRPREVTIVTEGRLDDRGVSIAKVSQGFYECNSNSWCITSGRAKRVGQ